MIQIINIIIFYILGYLLNKAFVVNNEETIFSYNIGVNEILLSFLFTFLIGIILYNYYNKSSLNYFFKIFKKILFLELSLFSFIIGTLKWKFFDFSNINKLRLLYTALITGLFFCLERFEAYEFKVAEKKNKEPDLYKSRGKYLSIIDMYLQNMESFSITGEWGIGKTKLIENFFEKECKETENKYYKDKYEYIYIDSSMYSENEKIIETLEEELTKKFKKYKVLKFKNSFVKNVFLQNETILKVLHNFFSFEISPKNDTRNLANEITKKNKILVICLDNLERLGSRERICNLFSIVDEFISENIKKIYIYDEEYMKKIFKKNEDDFIEYIEKYVFNKISLTKVEDIGEIIKEELEIKNVIRDLEKKNKKVKDYIISQLKNENSELIPKVEIYMEQLKKITNPRYIENLKKYIRSLKNKYNGEIEYLVEYKIIRDTFNHLSKTDILENENFFENNNKNNTDELKKNPDIITQKICVYHLFKSKEAQGKHYKSIPDIDIKLSCYEVFNNSLEMNEHDMVKKLEKLKNNPSENLIQILELMKRIYPYSYVKEIKEYLEKTSDKYIINNLNDYISLILSKDLNEYFDLLHPKLQLKIELNESNIFNKIKESYFINNQHINKLISFYFSPEQYKKYKEGLFMMGIESCLKKEFELTLEGFFIKLKKYFMTQKETFKEIGINIYSIENSLATFEKIKDEKIKGEKNKISKTKEISNIALKEILNSLEIKGKEIIIKNKLVEEKIVISKKNVEEYIKNVSSRKETDEELKEEIEYLLVKMYELKNGK